MADSTGTTPVEGQAPPAEPAAGTDPQPDEVTLLRSRNAGLDAKITELVKAERAAKAEAAEAAAKLAAYEAKTVGADEALRAQLQAERDATAAAKRDAQLARIEAKYPETYAVLGESAASLSEDRLAQNETRLKGTVESEEPPIPRGNNPSRTGQSPAPKEETSQDVLARLKTLGVPDEWRQRPAIG